jgi:ParB family chromosome partitioning protein
LTHAPFIALDDPPTAFLAFVNARSELKRLAGAYVAGLALTRSLNAPLLSLPIHDALAELLDLDQAETFRRYWTPTAELLDAIPTRQRLDLAEPFVERVAFGGWSRLKSAELTARVLEVVTGTGSWLRERTREAAGRWVHPLLAFGPPADRDQLQEAAE